MSSTPKDTWSASEYNKTASFVYSSVFSTPVLSLLNAQPGENIIDFGCGSGELPLHIKEIVGTGGCVVGVDASESMISKSKANGMQFAFCVDIQDPEKFVPAEWDTALPSQFDAVFTNAALHWCKRRPQGVMEAAKRVLKPGGRFVGEMGGFMNCIGIRSALHHVLRSRGHDPVVLDPWYFPSVDAYTARLEDAGFRVSTISLHPRITPLTGPLLDWLRLFCRHSWLQSFDEDEADAILRAVENMCRVDCRDEKGHWSIMYTRLRFHAVLP